MTLKGKLLIASVMAMTESILRGEGRSEVLLRSSRDTRDIVPSFTQKTRVRESEAKQARRAQMQRGRK